MTDSIQERNVYKTIGTQCEYLLIDGSNNASIAAAYNHGVNLSHGDILVFIRDDAYFMKPNWGQILINKFMQDQWLGIVGVAGSQYLYQDKPSLTAAGRPFIKGRVVHHLQNGDFFAVVYSQENGDFEVVACDGVFFAIRADLFSRIAFDEYTFTGDCFYDIDICMQARHTNRIIVTTDIVVKRRSQALFDKSWQIFGGQFIQKWATELPASTVDAVPDPENFQSTICVDLKGKYPIETIC
jgi:GT2 family glycosyltransferase